MTKTFTGIIAFILTFGVSVSLVGLLFGFPESGYSRLRLREQVPSKNKIRSLLIRDINNGIRRDRRLTYTLKGRSRVAKGDRFVKYHAIIEEYVLASTSINDNGLPADFKYAWREHMRAWNGDLQVLTKARDGMMARESFLAEEKASSREISETWEQVLRIAARYGVDTNNQFYR